MTRINLVDPNELTDQHLIAEYREIRLLCANFQRSQRSKTGIRLETIPQQFTLNRGHVRFFYNKGKYLHKRYDILKREMLSRGFNPQNHFPVDIWTKGSYNDWNPNSADLMIVRERIEERIMSKPQWYRYKGKHLRESGFQENLPNQTLPVYQRLRQFLRQ